MADLQNVMQGLECCSMNGKGCRQCPYNKECDEMPDFGNAQLCSDALELLKENDIELERIYQNICTYINGDCSTDTEADKQHVCEMIGRIFCAGGRVVLTSGVEAQGHWVVHGGRIGKNVDNRILECTVCNNYLSMSGVNGGRGNAFYCPNCGAIMDERVNQDD